jgi:hypothetical protein
MKHVICTLFIIFTFALNSNAEAIDRTDWTVTSSNNQGGIPNLLDGDVTSSWSTLDVQIPGQWIVIDFGKEETFNQIVLDQSNNHTDDYPRGYEVYVSNDPDVWGDPVISGAGKQGPATKIDIFADRTAQYIKIIQTGSVGLYWSIDELYVNLVTEKYDSFGWTATASKSNETADLIIDGDTQTKWHTGSLQQAGDWVIVDMKASVTFNQIVLDNVATPSDYPRKYAVYISDNGNDWDTPTVTGNGTPKETKINFFSDQTARFIKIELTQDAGDAYWAIHELYVKLADDFRLATATANRNNENASKALDGDLTTRWDTGEVLDGDEWFVVDMKKPLTFTKIILETPGGDYPPQYEVHISNDGEAWGDAIASGAGAQDQTEIILPSLYTAQYIKIAQTGTAGRYWSINEFRVTFATDEPFVIAAGTSASADDYIDGGYKDIIFVANDTDGTGELTNIPANGLKVYGVVKLKKTFSEKRWYALGFPFKVESFYEDNEADLSMYEGPAQTDGNSWVKKYNPVEDEFQYYTAGFLAAGEGYVIQFPEAFTDKEITFISEAHPVITNNPALSAVVAGYQLKANPSVANSLVSSITGADYFYLFNNDNTFVLNAAATLKPFESFIAAKGTDGVLPFIEIDKTELGINAIDTNDALMDVKYYTLQGIEVQQPVKGEIYLVKRIYKSRKTEVIKAKL